MKALVFVALLAAITQFSTFSRGQGVCPDSISTVWIGPVYMKGGDPLFPSTFVVSPTKAIDTPPYGDVKCDQKGFIQEFETPDEDCAAVYSTIPYPPKPTAYGCIYTFFSPSIQNYAGLDLACGTNTALNVSNVGTTAEYPNVGRHIFYNFNGTINTVCPPSTPVLRRRLNHGQV